MNPALVLVIGVLAVSACSPAPPSTLTKEEARRAGKADSVDHCKLFDWYGDGVCDEFCADPDPDCDGEPSEQEGLWAGVNSADIFDEPEARRHEMLDTLASQNLRVIRVWIDYRFEQVIGTFDSSLLDKIDVLIEECAARDLKLMIVFHSSYWMVHDDARDPYLSRWTVEQFYRDRGARDAYRSRVQAIMQHVGPGGIPWTENDTIWAWELQNEPLIFGTGMRKEDKIALVRDWFIEMAALVRQLDPDDTHIALGTAGYGPYYYRDDGVGDSLLGLGNIPDATIYTLHYYGGGGGLGRWIDDARAVTDPLGKLLMVEEFNPMRSDPAQAERLRAEMSVAAARSTPWMLWEYGAARDDDDIYHDEEVWNEVVVPGAANIWEQTWMPPGQVRWGVNPR